MPFKLRIEKLGLGDGELEIIGRVVDGAYAGPELIALHLADGRTLETSVIHHSLEHPQDWPVVPSHVSTLLSLSVPALPRGAKLDASKPVVGMGTLVQNARRTDITHLASDPAFWATLLNETLVSEDHETPHETFFGVSHQRVTQFYEKHIDANLQAGVWPYFRLELNDRRYFEYEFAAGIEYQQRFWIGRGDRRVILGFHSGHSSLPAFRPTELAAATDTDNVARAAMLLVLFTGVYAPDVQSACLPHLRLLLDALPEKAVPTTAILHAFGNSLTVPSVEWSVDSTRGWVNNGPYSQRNAGGPMSVLTDSDFSFIRDFFGVD